MRPNIIIQEPCGITDQSKQFFLDHKEEIGHVEAVSCFGVPVDGEYNVIIEGVKGQIRVDGFSWGYMGEGPRGLRWLLEETQCGTIHNRDIAFSSKASVLCFLAN